MEQPETSDPIREAPQGPTRRRHRPSSRGAWTIFAIFGVGLGVLAGLMLVPRNKPPEAPTDLPWGVPGEPVSVVTCDLSGRQVNVEALAAEVRALSDADGRGGISPDYLIVAHIGADDAMALARVMLMQASYRPQHHQRALGGAGLVGVCVLSRLPLYEGGPLRIDKKRSAGVSAVAVAGGQKFRLACLYAGAPDGGSAPPLLEQRKAESRPPALLALLGDDGAAVRHREMLSKEFVEVGPRGGASHMGLLVTPEWQAVGTGTASGGMALHRVSRRPQLPAPAAQP